MCETADEDTRRLRVFNAQLRYVQKVHNAAQTITSMARTRARRASCKEMMCGTGAGITRTLASEEVMAMGGQTTKCPTASCPAYTGVIVFLLIMYLFWLSVIWTFRPGFVRKAGAAANDPNNVSLTAGCLYSLLFEAVVLVAIALVLRCKSCM